MGKMKVKRLSPELSRLIIDTLGGTKRVAEVFGYSMPAISQWKTAGIPKLNLFKLKVMFKANPHLNSDEVNTFLKDPS